MEFQALGLEAHGVYKMKPTLAEQLVNGGMNGSRPSRVFNVAHVNYQNKKDALSSERMLRSA